MTLVSVHGTHRLVSMGDHVATKYHMGTHPATTKREESIELVTQCVPQRYMMEGMINQLLF